MYKRTHFSIETSIKCCKEDTTFSLSKLLHILQGQMSTIVRFVTVLMPDTLNYVKEF